MSPLVPAPMVSLQEVENALDNPGLMKRAVDELNDLPLWLPPLLGRWELLHVQPGSRFELDDGLKQTEPPSAQVIDLLRSAYDHWRALVDAIMAERVRPLAGYTLIRSAIEASALAIWLMSSPSTDKRLRASIRLSLENRRDTETFSKRLHGVDNKMSSEITKWFRAEMTATKNQRSGTKSLGLDSMFPKLTTLLQETDRQMKFDGLRGLDAWRACSGFAHSNSHFAGGSLVPAPAGEKGVTGRVTNLWMMVKPAQGYFEHALDLAEQWMAPTPGKGPVR